MLNFTQTVTFDLADDEVIAELLGELYPITFDMLSSLKNIDLADPGNLLIAPSVTLMPGPMTTQLWANLTINAPKGASIDNFISMYYSHMPTPSFRGLIFDGWFLDADLTIPVTTFTRMPEGGVVLHPGWRIPRNLILIYEDDETLP